MRCSVPRVLGAALLLAGAAACAQEPPADFRAECERRLDSSRIEVRVTPLAFTTDVSLGVQELTGRRPAPGSKWTLGLTVSDRRTTYSYGAARLVREDGWACIRPRFEVVVAVSPQRVYVAREFPKGSCAFNEILAHELRHVQVNQDQARAAAMRFQAEMRQAFGNTVYYGEQHSLKRQLEQVMVEGWIPWLREELERGERHHAAIDTDEEYARMGKVCGGEVPRTLRALGLG